MPQSGPAAVAPFVADSGMLPSAWSGLRPVAIDGLEACAPNLVDSDAAAPAAGARGAAEAAGAAASVTADAAAEAAGTAAAPRAVVDSGAGGAAEAAGAPAAALRWTSLPIGASDVAPPPNWKACGTVPISEPGDAERGQADREGPGERVTARTDPGEEPAPAGGAKPPRVLGRDAEVAGARRDGDRRDRLGDDPQVRQELAAIPTVRDLGRREGSLVRRQGGGIAVGEGGDQQ